MKPYYNRAPVERTVRRGLKMKQDYDDQNNAIKGLMVALPGALVFWAFVLYFFLS